MLFELIAEVNFSDQGEVSPNVFVAGPYGAGLTDRVISLFGSILSDKCTVRAIRGDKADGGYAYPKSLVGAFVWILLVL